MLVLNANNKKNQISKVNRFYKRLLEEMDQEASEETRQVRMGENNRNTEERSTPHTRDIEETRGVVSERHESGVEQTQE